MKRIYLSLIAVLATALCLSCNPEGPQGENGTNPGDEKLVITQSTTTIEANGKDAVLFTAKLGDKVITEGITYYDAQTNQPVDIVDNKFTTTVAGKYTFWAVYETAISDKFSVKAVDYALPALPADPKPEAGSFFKKLLTIYFTGTGCPNCPAAKDKLHNITSDSDYADRLILTAAHTYNESDPAYLSPAFANACGVGSYPTIVYDMFVRCVAGGVSEDALKSVFDETYNSNSATAGISAASIINGDQIAVKVSVKSAIDGELRAGVMLLEDGIYAAQSGGKKEEHNIHDDCIRTIIGRQSNSDFTGENLGTFAVGQEKAFVFDPITIKKDWKKENLKLVVFVSSYSAKENSFVVTNCAALPVNGSVQYLYK